MWKKCPSKRIFWACQRLHRFWLVGNPFKRVKNEKTFCAKTFRPLVIIIQKLIVSKNIFMIFLLLPNRIWTTISLPFIYSIMKSSNIMMIRYQCYTLLLCIKNLNWEIKQTYGWKKDENIQLKNQLTERYFTFKSPVRNMYGHGLTWNNKETEYIYIVLVVDNTFWFS